MVVIALGLGLLSLAFPTTPTYDPWAWLIWGREIVHADLVTDGGPSWKPLPVVFTVPFALAGDEVAPDLWMVVARAGGALALLMAFRLGWRLAGRGFPGFAAGLLALLGLLGMSGWLRVVGLGNSEGLLIALVLTAVDRHLDGRRDHAVLLGAGAALLRPEVWPFLGLYGVVLWGSAPRWRWHIVATGLLVLAAWFLPEAWGSGDLMRSAERASHPLPSSSAFAERPALEVLRVTGSLLVVPLYAGALIAVGVALVAFVRRRAQAAVLVLAFGACASIAVVMMMTEAGYSGNRRYLMLAGALICVLGGVGFAWAARATARAVECAGGRRHLALAAGALVMAGVLALAWPWAKPRGRELGQTVRALRSDAEATPQLERLVARLGGPSAVLRCGKPTAGRFQRPIMAWTLGVHAREVAFMPDTGVPGLVFRKRSRRPLEPALPPAGPRYRRVAELGQWEVVAVRCADGRRPYL